MGKRAGPMEPDFPEGTKVRIIDRDRLAAFAKTWKYHHPLKRTQMTFAGRTAVVVDVSFYHGGDELYELKGIPGIWHGECLEPVPK